MTRRALTRIEGWRDQYRFAEYGLQRSNLSCFGALPSRGISDVYRDTKDGDVVLLAGGENLAQTWLDMHLTLLGPDAAKMLARVRNTLGLGIAERLSRWRFHSRQRFPYILSPDVLPRGVRVMYNSMGGWPLRHYAPPAQRSIVRAMSKASFISVRDNESASILQQLDPTLPLHVSPDCVFLLSDLFPKDELAAKASPEVRELVRNSGEFISFQCHPRYGAANRDELKRQLHTLADRTGMNILMTPIGRIYSFEDDVFLASLASEMESKTRMLPASAGIYDVAYALASACLFCGTSLHGVISALTYGVPFVPLASEDPKLSNNVESWGLAESFPQALAVQLADEGLKALKLSGPLLAAQAARLRMEAHENMHRLGQHILAA